MLYLQSLAASPAKPLSINLGNVSLRKLARVAYSFACSSSVMPENSDVDERNNYSGIKIEEKVEVDSGKLRLDSWISSRINGISRVRVQSSIRSGLVSVNGCVVSKVSHMVRDGDLVNCIVAELQPLRAEPEKIPLDIVYEDEHLLVVNKPAHLVVHPAPGNATGTLVNGILHHCSLPDACFNRETLSDIDDDFGDKVDAISVNQNQNGATTSVRPGIVHRLDKGTSGLLVVAKDEHSHSHLAEQFKNHTIKRIYVSLTCGVPSPVSGRINIPIGRDVNNRIRMVAIPGTGGHVKTRHAVSSGNIPSIVNSRASFYSNSLSSLLDSSDSYTYNNYRQDNHSGVKDVGSARLKYTTLKIGRHVFPRKNGISGARTYLRKDPNSLSLPCRTPNSFSIGRQGHANGAQTTLFCWSYCRTKILSLYSAHKYSTDSKNLQPFSKATLFSFTSQIMESSKSNDCKNTLNLFSQMLKKEFHPDARILPSVIKACSGLLYDRIGKQIHGFSMASGLYSDSFVESSLIHFYVKCDELAYANALFDNMVGSDVVSWSALAAGYARKGDVANANRVFNEVKSLGFKPNVVSWNGMIAGFNQSGCFVDAMLMFQRMHSHGFKSDGTSISSVLPAIGDFGSLNFGTQVHGHAVKIGFSMDKCIVSALIGMYSKGGSALDMCKVCEDMGHVDVAAYNALITGLARHSLVDKALGVFKEIQGRGMELNVISWTSVIACCSQHGKDMEALDLFREMQVAGVKPNSVTIPCLLPACGNIAALSHGKAAHCFSLRTGILDNVYVGSALIDMYANCGKIQIARLCFDRMPVHNLVCWNAILGAYAMHGKAREAIEVFHWMQRSHQKPDSITFISLLSACSQAGLTEEGRQYFESMFKDHGIEARTEHYACIVSLLGRAGKLNEAYSMIKNMPFKPDGCVWGALLSSCRLHQNTSLGEIAADQLFELEPKNPGNYILLSNIYASKGKWKEVDKVRDFMRDKGLKKNPGCSWIEVKNKVHMLLAGDKSFPQMPQILDKLNKLNVEFKNAGYLPCTNYVLQDVEEQEKEHILCGHSEKLAVVFGILNTSPRSSLRVTKNLRICGDCHEVIKFISKIEEREIFVRDTNRYHHFKEGACSCKDYW